MRESGVIRDQPQHWGSAVIRNRVFVALVIISLSCANLARLRHPQLRVALVALDAPRRTSKSNNQRDQDQRSPILVLHAGPHKTATSTIQCDLSRHREELYTNASIAYLGRLYAHCQSDDPNRFGPSIGLKLDTRKLINECLDLKPCEKVYKLLNKQLEYLSNHNKSVLISDEAFSRIRFRTKDNSIDNRLRLYELFNKYYPGRVHIVVVYRRYYAWLKSQWNEAVKPFNNEGRGKYLTTFCNWPSEGGRTSATFRDYLKIQAAGGPVNVKHPKYYHVAFKKNLHPAEYVRQSWINYSSKAVILNMHELMQRDDGEDVTTSFVRANFPSVAGDVLASAKMRDADPYGRPNPSRNLDFDRLAVTAHGRGLLAGEGSTRQRVAEMTEKHLLKKLNATVDLLPLICPDGPELEDLLRKSLEYERQLFPDRSKEVAGQHAADFLEEAERRKFCNLDTDELIDHPAVQKFFTRDIPRLLGKRK